MLARLLLDLRDRGVDLRARCAAMSATAECQRDLRHVRAAGRAQADLGFQGSVLARNLPEKERDLDAAKHPAVVHHPRVGLPPVQVEPLIAVQREQVRLGINTFHQKAYLDNIGEANIQQNDQLEQAAQANPLLQGQTEYDPSQVGNLLLQQESCETAPRLPLEILVAQTQGQIGYMIESTLDSELMALGMITQKPLVTDEWQFLVAPYLWFVGLNGNIAVNGDQSDVDASFGDIWDQLDFAFQIHAEAMKNNYFFFN